MSRQWIGFLRNTTVPICLSTIPCRLFTHSMNGAKQSPNPCRWLISSKCYVNKGWQRQQTTNRNPFFSNQSMPRLIVGACSLTAQILPFLRPAPFSMGKDLFVPILLLRIHIYFCSCIPVLKSPYKRQAWCSFDNQKDALQSWMHSDTIPFSMELCFYGYLGISNHK